MVSNNRIETKIDKIETRIGKVEKSLEVMGEELQSIGKEFKKYPTREEVKQMIYDGVDIIRVLIENYRSDFRSAVDGYKGLDGRVGSLEHRVDTLEKQV